MKDLISVIVPIYQIERYIGTCIESLMKQTYKNLEIILVDDGSKDRCGEICDLYAQKDSRIRVIHKENGGLVSARKAGLLVATGQYIGYVDGDDWVEPGYYESLYMTAVSTDADMIAAGQSRDLFDKSECFCNSISSGVYEGEKLEELRRNMISNEEFYRPGITTYVWNKLFKKEILFEHQMQVDERITIGEDAAVTYPAIMSCKKICVTDNCAYHYRQREDSMLKKRNSFSTEAEKLRYLYEYMTAFAKRQSEIYDIQKQVNDFVLGICMMRSGGGIHEKDIVNSVFGDIYFGKDVVVYSAGTFGQQLLNRLEEKKCCHVVGWIDDDYWEYRRCCLNVDAVESIRDMTYDYILVATIDCRIANNIKRRLLNYGVMENKILLVQCPNEKREQLLHRYLYM